MRYESFREFEKDYSAPYNEKKYDEVLGILNRAAEVLPEKEYKQNEFNVMLDKARIYSELKQSTECLSMIREVLESGYAFPLVWKRFDFLRNEKDYTPIKDLNDSLLLKARAEASLKYEVHLPDSYDENKKYPLFLSLHGDGADGNVPNHNWYWTPDSLLEKGYLVVYPQSSQVYCHNGFGWLIDPLKSREELKSCYERLLSQYSIDENNIIVGGFSGGSTASIDVVLSGTIPAKGFVALCPGDNIISLTKEAAEKAASKGVKGVIFEGEFETEDYTQEMLKLFEEAGFPCEYRLNKNIGHWYPENLGELLVQAVDFITG